MDDSSAMEAAVDACSREDVRAEKVKRIFAASGLPPRPIHDVRWRKVDAQGDDAGAIAFARDWRMDDVRLHVPTGASVRIPDSRDVEAPVVTTR